MSSKKIKKEPFNSGTMSTNTTPKANTGATANTTTDSITVLNSDNTIDVDGNYVPAILKQEQLLVPIKIDVSHNGARVVDTFCWDLRNSPYTPEEFAELTCKDMNLPNGFAYKLFMQLQEQLESYSSIISDIVEHAHKYPIWRQKIKIVQNISVGLRLGTVDYSDKIRWDPMDESITPEQFANITCDDLGLPDEFRPAISHKLRESLLRWIITLLFDPENADILSIQNNFSVSDTQVSVVTPSSAVDMCSNLWTRAKPSSYNEESVIPQPILPLNLKSNGYLWRQKLERMAYKQ